MIIKPKLGELRLPIRHRQGGGSPDLTRGGQSERAVDCEFFSRCLLLKTGTILLRECPKYVRAGPVENIEKEPKNSPNPIRIGFSDAFLHCSALFVKRDFGRDFCHFTPPVPRAIVRALEHGGERPLCAGECHWDKCWHCMRFYFAGIAHPYFGRSGTAPPAANLPRVTTTYCTIMKRWNKPVQ
jgi:hypothetical protein